MHWWYKLISKTETTYTYAYSCDNKDLDGVITYYLDTKEAEITKASATDKNSQRLLDRSLSKFFFVVNEGFPDERHVCCG